MYCPNCGNKLSKSDKFCSSCGKAIEIKDTKYKLKASALRRLDLLEGLDKWLDEQLIKQPTGNPYLALRTTLNDYSDRYSEQSKLLKFMAEDTKKFIFNGEIADVINTGMNQDELEKLSQDDKNNFDKFLPLLDGIRADIIVIGYLYRLNSEYENRHTRPSEFNGAKNPQEAFQKLFNLDEKYPDMFIDSGFRFPSGPIWVLNDDGALLSTLNKNIEKTHRVGKILLFPNNETLMIMLLVGWCLARFDLFRKNKLTESTL